MLFLNDEASQKVLLAQFPLSAQRVDRFLNDADFAFASGDIDELEEHFDILTKRLVGLASNPHPVIQEDELFPVLYRIDHHGN